MHKKTAVVVGASSGIGEGLARVLVKNNYRVGLIARREKILKTLQKEFNNDIAQILTLDITDENAGNKFKEFLKNFGEVDLIILNAGVGFSNPNMETNPELDTVDINVRAFTRLSATSFRYFKKQKFGHIVGISSIVSLAHTPSTPAYAASKAYVSSYLAGLRAAANNEGLNITITDIKPGFVDTPMAKSANLFWVSPVEKAAIQIFNVIRKKKNHAYITKRWRLIAWLIKLLPENIFNKIVSKI